MTVKATTSTTGGKQPEIWTIRSSAAKIAEKHCPECVLISRRSQIYDITGSLLQCGSVTEVQYACTEFYRSDFRPGFGLKKSNPLAY